MPPHCDALDGPVVRAARQALEADDVSLVLPFVPADGEGEVKAAFDRTTVARAQGGEAQQLADRWFFETVVRIHRAGEGAPFTGLKPAGLDVGPAIPAAERALESGSDVELAMVLCDEVREQVHARLRHALWLRSHADHGLEAARAATEAALGLQVWAHSVHKAVVADRHAHG